MAEGDRAVAESSASRNLQGGMELHLCCSRLQLGPYAESGDSNDVSRDRSAFTGEKRIASYPRRQSKLFPEAHNRGARRESKWLRPFFRSLLSGVVLFADRQETISDYAKWDASKIMSFELQGTFRIF